MKKIIYGIWILLFVICFHLSFRYIMNEIYIGKYNDSIYENKIINFLLLFNYPESYVAHYNKGNNYYNLKDFDNAVNEYNSALKTVKGDRRCKVLINLSLSKLELIDLKSNDVKQKLIDIQNILLDSNCATSDNKGKNEDAQELYNEIEKLLNSSGGGSGDQDDEKDNNNDDNNNQNDYKDIENKLKEQQQQSSEDREKNQRKEYKAYTGKSW